MRHQIKKLDLFYDKKDKKAGDSLRALLLSKGEG